MNLFPALVAVHRGIHPLITSKHHLNVTAILIFLRGHALVGQKAIIPKSYLGKDIK